MIRVVLILITLCGGVGSYYKLCYLPQQKIKEKLIIAKEQFADLNSTFILEEAILLKQISSLKKQIIELNKNNLQLTLDKELAELKDKKYDNYRRRHLSVGEYHITIGDKK